jgi:hypothetical protein
VPSAVGAATSPPLTATAGAAAGTARTAAAASAPWPRVAAAAAAASSTQPGMWEALRRVVRTEGVRSLWKGNMVTIIHRIPYSSINFYTYEVTSRWLAEALPPGADVSRRLGAGAMSGLVACSTVRRRAAPFCKMGAQRLRGPTIA